MTSNGHDGVQMLRDRIEVLRSIPASSSGREFQEWLQKTRVVLRHVLGSDSDFAKEFDEIRFWGPFADPREGFERGRNQAFATLEAASYSLELSSQAIAPEGGTDFELWSHVRHLVESGQWTQAASQTAIFVESKLRQWSGLDASLYGKNLMTEVFKPGSGQFPLGNSDAEEQGWHNLALGFSGALANVDRHRIQEREDIQTYAMGVVGLGSLLLTQLRYQHGNRFRSSPTE